MFEAPILTTPRLRLRMLRDSDFEEYAAIHMDDEVTRYTARTHLTRFDSWRHMATMVGHWHLRGYGFWAVEELATGRLAGRVGFWNPDGWPDFECGWTIGREFWGRGYAPEAARECLRYGFEVLQRPHVISLIDPENKASIAVAEKVGESLSGETEILGHRVLVYKITAAEWAAAASR